MLCVSGGWKRVLVSKQYACFLDLDGDLVDFLVVCFFLIGGDVTIAFFVERRLDLPRVLEAMVGGFYRNVGIRLPDANKGQVNVFYVFAIVGFVVQNFN